MNGTLTVMSVRVLSTHRLSGTEDKYITNARTAGHHMGENLQI